VPGVIPPLGLRIFVGGQIAGKGNSVKFGSVAQNFGLPGEGLGYRFEQRGRGFLHAPQDSIKIWFVVHQRNISNRKSYILNSIRNITPLQIH
jgi:hypothetical protein